TTEPSSVLGPMFTHMAVFPSLFVAKSWLLNARFISTLTEQRGRRDAIEVIPVCFVEPIPAQGDGQVWRPIYCPFSEHGRVAAKRRRVCLRCGSHRLASAAV